MPLLGVQGFCVPQSLHRALENSVRCCKCLVLEKLEADWLSIDCLLVYLGITAVGSHVV